MHPISGNIKRSRGHFSITGSEWLIYEIEPVPPMDQAVGRFKNMSITLVVDQTQAIRRAG